MSAKAVEEWATEGFLLSEKDFAYKGKVPGVRPLKLLPYKSLNLNEPWENSVIAHELKTKGIRGLVEDYQNTLQKIASHWFRAVRNS